MSDTEFENFMNRLGKLSDLLDRVIGMNEFVREKAEEPKEEEKESKEQIEPIDGVLLALKKHSEEETSKIFDFDSTGFRCIALTIEKAIPDEDGLAFFSKESIKQGLIYIWEDNLIKAYDGKNYTLVPISSIADELAKPIWSHVCWSVVE